MTDQLIRLAQTGEHEAFLELLKTHDRQLMSVVYRFAGNACDREDLYQDIFLHVFKSIKSYNFKADFRTWLYRVALNRCCSFMRRKPSEVPLAESPAGFRADFETRAKLKSVQKALAGLRGPQRICFHLYYIEDWEVEDIAAVLNCKPGTVKAHLQRARNKVRSSWEVRKWRTSPT